MVKSTLYNHYLLRICSLDVDMNYANEASLYCRRLESITFSPHIYFLLMIFNVGAETTIF
jgi:hypothetical protein